MTAKEIQDSIRFEKRESERVVTMVATLQVNACVSYDKVLKGVRHVEESCRSDLIGIIMRMIYEDQRNELVLAMNDLVTEMPWTEKWYSARERLASLAAYQQPKGDKP